MLVLGADPGLTGACALVDTDALRVLDVLDLPVVRAGAAAWVDGAVLGDWIERLAPDLAVVELVHCFPNDPRPSNTALMVRLSGGIEAILSSLAIPLHHVQPSAWKRRAGLRRQDKTASLALAASRLSWPKHAPLSLAKHHGRAEAALVALYGRAPAVPPKPPKRSKAVLSAMAASVPPGPLFGGGKTA